MFRQLMALLFTLACVAHAATAADDTTAPGAKTSSPFEYAGYTIPEFRSFQTSSEYVMMSDGEKLAVDVHLPADGPERASFPVILEYLPYQRSTIDIDTGKVDDVTRSGKGRFFLARGYAFVRADMRGTGASTGCMMDFMPRLAKDGEQLVTWISRQPWCDGNVGMMGSSYLGWSQTATASHWPQALKCITPECVPLDGYTGEAYPGGIFLEGFFSGFCEYMKRINENYSLPGQGIRPAKPVVDEDGDGALQDEIPIDLNKNGTFLDDTTPPVYSDGATRNGVYLEATIRHQKGNYDYGEWAAECAFIDSPTPIKRTMYDLSPGAHIKGLARSQMPIYHFGGWFDAFTRGTCELYATLAPTNASKLVLGPSYHDFTSGPAWKHFGFADDRVEEMYLVEHLRFFDRYLKNVDNGIDREPPIYIFVMNGEGWRCENEWPLARQVVKTLFCDANSALRDTPTREGKDVYKADLTHSSTFGPVKGNRYLGIIGEVPDGLPVRTEKDKQCLCYTSSPLPADTEVTGHPIAHLSVSSTAEDGDFFVYLEDVDEAGSAVLVTEGLLRAGFHGLRNNNEMVRAGKSGVNVLPDLPWHGFQKDQYNPRPFAGETVVQLDIDLQPTAWVFKKGHSIRLSIACADYPTFRLHPELSPQNKPDAPDNVIPTVTLHHNALHQSYVELPVIPPVR